MSNLTNNTEALNTILTTVNDLPALDVSGDTTGPIFIVYENDEIKTVEVTVNGEY